MTNTHKPDIFVRAGAVIATAEALLREGDISMEILSSTGIPTPMGDIIIVRAMASGYVQLGGASITAYQQIVRDKLYSFGCTRVLIDGAISRKSLGNPSLADGVILSSGASYDPSIGKTVSDTAYIARLFSLEEAGFMPGAARFTAIRGEERQEAEEADALIPLLKEGAEALVIRGAVTDGTAAQLTNIGKLLAGAIIVSEDASRLLLKPASFEKLLRFSGGVRVLKGTRLLAVSVNPFSAYGLHYEGNEFYDRVEAALAEAGVCVPVIDVKV